jgi:hypothetical protein
MLTVDGTAIAGTVINSATKNNNTIFLIIHLSFLFFLSLIAELHTLHYLGFFLGFFPSWKFVIQYTCTDVLHLSIMPWLARI